MEKLKKILVASLCITLMLLVYITCRPVVKEGNRDYKGAPEQIISLEQGKELFDNYTERRVRLIEEYESREGQAPFDATRYGEYDYETIKQYLAFIEHEAEAANVEISKLRIYFGNYPQAEKFDDGRKVKYPRKNTFLILPTLKKGGEDYGFYIDKQPDGKKVALLITDRFPQRGQKQDLGQEPETLGSRSKSYASFLPNAVVTNAPPYYAEESLILNEGSMVPPPRKKTDF
jgi:hypothetical protein